jgi:hypothetical protein
MDLSKLPKPGSDFSVSDRLGGFKHKMEELTLRGEYKNLRNNLDAILHEVEEYKEYIKRGGLSRGQRLRIWNKIRHLDKNITHEDMLEIKKILEYLSE